MGDWKNSLSGEGNQEGGVSVCVCVCVYVCVCICVFCFYFFAFCLLYNVLQNFFLIRHVSDGGGGDKGEQQRYKLEMNGLLACLS